MSELTIPLSESQSSFLDEMIAKRAFRSRSEAMLALLEEARLGKECERLEAMIQEGIDSGPVEELTLRDWDSIRAQVRERLVERSGQHGRFNGDA